MDIQRDSGRNSGAYVGATILIVIGVCALVANLGGSSYVYESIPLAIGVAFLVAYTLTRRYGFLVPGGILSGVGAGLLASALNSISDGGPYIVIGGGLGFLLIFCVDLLVSRTTLRWWPVIPGGLMLLAGAGTVSQNHDFGRQFEIVAPLLVIGLGVVILLTRTHQPKR